MFRRRLTDTEKKGEYDEAERHKESTGHNLGVTGTNRAPNRSD